MAGKSTVARAILEKAVAAWMRWKQAHTVFLRRVRFTLHFVAVACLCLLAFYYARHVLSFYGHTCVDDAGITCAYADNLGHGRGLRLTPGEAPTEGFSNPLLVLALAPVSWFTSRLCAASRLINVVLTALALALLCVFAYANLRSIGRLFSFAPLFLAASWCGFNFWLTSGLETGMFTALQILSLLALHLAARHPAADVALGFAAGLLAWTRPEGFVYGAIAILARFLSDPAGRRWLAPGVFLTMIVSLVGARWCVFRDLVPNTFWGKVEGEGLWWTLKTKDSAGRLYADGFFSGRRWYFAVPLWACAPAWREAQPATLAALGQLAFALIFPIVVGGDWMPEWRFMQSVMGPLAVLSSIGLVGLLGREACKGSALATMIVVVLAAVVTTTPSRWKEKRKDIAELTYLTFEQVGERAAGYRRLSGAIHLGRAPLVADVDVGGLAFRSGIEVLDLGGLADRALAISQGRVKAIAPDYVFGERLPDVMHLHSGWLIGAPYNRLSAFRTLYREMAGAGLERLGLASMTAVRADLTDPVAPPALRLDHPLPDVRITGLSAIPSTGGLVLVVHGRQLSDKDPAPLVLEDSGGGTFTAPWHAGLELAASAPEGAFLAAVITLPETALPLGLQGTEVRIGEWPLAAADDRSAEGLARLPLLRISGSPVPPCDPDRVLDPDADPTSRARGAGFVAHLCGGLPPSISRRWYKAAVTAAKAADDPDDRYDAAAATLSMGLGQKISTRLLLEKARRSHTPFDEVLDAWAREDLASDPGREATGLRMLLAARRFSDALLSGLALGTDAPDAAGAVCTAARKLGLRPDAVARGLDCSSFPDVPLPRVVRQSFEDPSDPLLEFGSRTLLPVQMHRITAHQQVFSGGHGRLIVNSFGSATKDRATGEVTWGPIPWAGRRFGALIGGGNDIAHIHVAVEGLVDGAWIELARLAHTSNSEILEARIADLGPNPAEKVRVRIVDDGRNNWGHILADALTFIDVP